MNYLSNYLGLTAIDFNAGLGGHSFACSRAGINVIAALENDERYRAVFRDINPDIPVLSFEEIPTLSQADIIVATLSAQELGITRSNNHTHFASQLLCELICHVLPRSFLIKVPYAFLQSRVPSFLNEYLLQEYSLSYQVLQEDKYSDFLVSGRQTYVVGIRKDYYAHFSFPAPEHSKVFRDFFRKPAELIDPWYRKLPSSLCLTNDVDKRLYLYRNYTKREYYTDVKMKTAEVMNCFLCDEIGLRRITHEEYAQIKGYPDYPFDKLHNRSQFYQMLQASPNLYIAQAIIHSLTVFLNKQKTVESLSNQPPSSKKIVSHEKNPIIQARNTVLELHIDKLKGLKNLDISFGKGLTAIMGVNGAGKSTILHALACMFAPDKDGEDHKFNFFFTPTPDASWQGSSFWLRYLDENSQTEIVRKYGKTADRWSPRYANRPKRDVFYYGINTGLPEIEKERQTTFIDYHTDFDADKLSTRVAAAASEILCKDYKQLTHHKTKRKSFLGVHTKSGITYSSLSMGAGEQRVIKILTTIYHAKPYSMILIDELDLLLHSDAQRRLIKKLAELASEKSIQIIFTTHSLEIGKMIKYVHVQYLYHTREKTMVYDRITSDIVFELSHQSEQPLEIYVEDDLSETIVLQVARGLNLSHYIKVRNIGSAQNAFTLAAGFVIQQLSLENKLIVLDGDIHRDHDEKKKQIKKVFSGTELDHDSKIEAALSAIVQYDLPEKISPEEYIFNLLLELDEGDELTNCAKKITLANDTHDYVNCIVERMNQDRAIVLYQIVQEVAESEKWGDYIAAIRNWLLEKRDQFSLNP